jgi:hypothetical protein
MSCFTGLVSASLSSTIIFPIAIRIFPLTNWLRVESNQLSFVSRPTVLHTVSGLWLNFQNHLGVVLVSTAFQKARMSLKNLVAISICYVIHVFHSICSCPFSGAAGAAAR